MRSGSVYACISCPRCGEGARYKRIKSECKYRLCASSVVEGVVVVERQGKEVQMDRGTTYVRKGVMYRDGRIAQVAAAVKVTERLPKMQRC